MVKKSLESNAKINIGLNIIGKNADSYHILDMLMAPINLSDTLKINFYEKKGNLSLKSNINSIPLDKDNIIYKVYEKYYDFLALQREEIEVYLIKRVPFEAGLGGGSSNGAFFLKALNEYHGNLLSLEEMIELGKNIGADIPFFLINKTARVKGIGEKVELIENNCTGKILLIKPNFGISTALAYKAYGNLKNKKSANIDQLMLALKINKLDILNSNIENHLQQSALFLDSRIKTFEERLFNINKNFKMSGSGSCYYLISEKEESKIIYEKLIQKFGNCFISLNDFI